MWRYIHSIAENKRHACIRGDAGVLFTLFSEKKSGQTESSAPTGAGEKDWGKGNQPQRAVSMGMICFLRETTPGRKAEWSRKGTPKACVMVSSSPT